MRSTKLLGRKNYGSIPHLPGSRPNSPSDKTVGSGGLRILTQKSRPGDEIFVQEKLDGSNVGVYKKDGVLYPVTRSGHHARTSTYSQHIIFADWLEDAEIWDRFDDILLEGERIVGEWLILAHGTKYDLPHEPFVAFDLMTPVDHFGNSSRMVYDEMENRLRGNFVLPNLIHRGGPYSIEEALTALQNGGGHGAIDPPEGAVWRCERGGKIEFLAKFVRDGKQDGCYLFENEVWNSWKGKPIRTYTK